MTRPAIGFYGTSAICLPFLEQLIHECDIRLIVTQPDSFGGRKRHAIVPPVKTFAIEHNIDVIQPETLSDDSVVEKISGIGADLGVVIAYGKLIPKKVYRLPVHRTVNVHFSMLPLYRGAAPVQRSLENGDTSSGITIFELVRKLDAGPIWTQKEMELLPEDTTETVWQRMSREGAPFLCQTIQAIVAGTIENVKQNHQLATLAPPIDKKEGCVSWDLSAKQLVDKCRAFTPWPGLYCNICDKVFKFTKISVAADTHDRTPGDVLEMTKKSLKVCCGDGTVLEIFEFQPQGKKPMVPYCYCLGNQLPDCLGDG